MGRWANSAEARSKWAECAHTAPYRASVGADICWGTDRPHWDLATALKSSRRGHRLLMAFELAEVRDYFVEGHRDQDAQVEPDGAEEAGPRQPKISRPAPRTLEEAKATVIASGLAEQAAQDEVERVFNREVDRLLTEHKAEEALRIIRSMHPDCAMRMIAFDAVRKSGQWDFDAKPLWKLEPMPFTQERAATIFAWLRAHLDNRAAEDDIGAIALPMAQDILDREGYAAVAAFNETMPPCMTKVFIADMADYGTPRMPNNDPPPDEEPAAPTSGM